jgi:hypothetical protein
MKHDDGIEMVIDAVPAAETRGSGPDASGFGECGANRDEALVQRRRFEAPQSPEERHIAQIWQDLLEIDNIGIHDNFLLLGGESLLATQVASRLREAFNVEVPVRSIFLGTIAEIAADIVKEKGTSATPASVQEHALSSVQVSGM